MWYLEGSRKRGGKKQRQRMKIKRRERSVRTEWERVKVEKENGENNVKN